MKNGVTKQVHLCEEHAREAGIVLPGQSSPQKIQQVLNQFVISKSAPGKRATKKSCPTCDMTFADFRHGSMLGCADCYETFEKELTPIIERSQNAGTHHVGKAPQRAGVSIDRQHQIRQLIKELDDAVAAEQYERAAALRDKLRTLEVSFPPTPANEPTET
ncbi:MAG: UvrB/UvrC motif-containing protein [Planctomycetota bacterium]